MEMEQWKQKYYDQLDRLEKKEQDWEKLESTLKRTIGRLSLAAEGQHAALDRHIGTLRNEIKNNINQQRLDAIVDDISRILTQIEEKQSQPNRNIVSALQQLITDLNLPDNCNKARKKLLKQLDKAEDDQRDALLKDTISLIASAITIDTSPATEKSGLLNRFFTTDKSTASESEAEQSYLQSVTSIFYQLLSAIPWPESLEKNTAPVITAIRDSNNSDDLKNNITKLEILINKWPSVKSIQSNDTVIDTGDNLKTYKNCFIELLNKIDSNDSPDGKLTALKITARDVTQKSELDKLGDQLSSILSSRTEQTTPVVSGTQTLDPALHDPSLQPSIQELLIRLLEQLIVPADLQDEANEMKHRLEKETDPADWKLLLKDVAILINSIRSRMQKEKHEFESFLQQVTDRLKAMDQFLQEETANLQEAESHGKQFDKNININVEEIRQDVNQATELNNLKQSVNLKLDTISDHILHYRESEKQRNLQSQQQVDAMHSRMQSLEKETETLKKVVVEKNKQAMFDVLTEIPNRLSYEKKIEEEIARWKRFKEPLSLAVWDIDFFKKVNDTYGHKAGDKVLKTVAQLLNKRIRATDFLARYGGEEFVMLLPGTKQEETLRLVNDLRKQVEDCGFHYHGDSVTITVSCGVSSFNQGDTVNKVFERADKALYKAKENGRNQCVVASSLSD